MTLISGQESGSSEANHKVKTILVVEDDKDIGCFLVEAIKEVTSYQALLVTDGYQALKAVHDIKPSLFLIDYGLPHMNGLELSDQFHATKELESIPVLMISANCPWQEAQKRQFTCLPKPLELDALLTTIHRLLA